MLIFIAATVVALRITADLDTGQVLAGDIARNVVAGKARRLEVREPGVDFLDRDRKSTRLNSSHG